MKKREFLIGTGDNKVLEITLSEKENSTVSASQRIWEQYKSFRGVDHVIRSGFGMYGIYDYDPKNQPKNSQESVAEHSRGASYLAELFGIFHPELFTRNERSPISADEKLQVLEGVNRVRILLDHHDLGEVAIGDIPDDGGSDHASKDATELQAFMAAVEYLPIDLRAQLVRDFAIFQKLNDGFWCSDITKYDVNLITIAKVCDKMDAVLKGLLYENDGFEGHLTTKEKRFRISERDREFKELIGADSVPDIWMAHFVSEWWEAYGFTEALEVVRVAVTDVRGTWFPWWDKLCEEYKIKLWQ